MPVLATVVEAIRPIIDILGSLISTILDVLTPVINGLASLLTGTLQSAFNIIIGVIDTVTGVFDGIITFIKGVFSGDWKKAWEGISSIFSGIWNGLEGIVKGAVNLVIGVINGFIKAYNFTIGNIGGWIGLDIKVDEIPLLKRGLSYVPKDDFPALLHVGERVMTKEQNEDFNAMGGLQGMEMALSGSASSGTGFSNAVIDIPLYIDGRQIARATAVYMGEQQSWEAM